MIQDKEIRSRVLHEVDAERERQQKIWGNDFDDLNTANDWVAYICRYIGEGAYNGREKKFTVARFRDFLVRAAAICCAAVETIDRNGGKLIHRHYDHTDNPDEFNEYQIVCRLRDYVEYVADKIVKKEIPLDYSAWQTLQKGNKDESN